MTCRGLRMKIRFLSTERSLDLVKVDNVDEKTEDKKGTLWIMCL